MANAIEIEALELGVVYRILYLNGTDMKIELLPYVLNFVPCAYEFGDGRHSELK